MVWHGWCLTLETPFPLNPFMKLRFFRPAGVLASLLLTLLLYHANGQVILTEFMADNEKTLKDEDGEYSDWIEIFNAGTQEVSLKDWALTDNPAEPKRWEFPAVTLAPGQHLVVFASDKNRKIAGNELHTNFKLSAGGEYLALVRPDGAPATEFSPAYPAQITDVSYGTPSETQTPPAYPVSTGGVFFATPTPGAVNTQGEINPGPAILEPSHSPALPKEGENITVTCRVVPMLAPVAGVTLRWRVMYNAENETPMTDDGQNSDARAGDGIFTAVLPASAFTTGEMVRWSFHTTDTAGRSSRRPLFRDPLNSPEYMGTMVENTLAAAQTELPAWYWFARSPGAADTRTGTRCSVFFNGRFYDNVFVRQRGGATSSNSRKFDFNTGDHCFINDEVGYVEEVNLNSSNQDPTLTRPPLSFELFKTAGHHSLAAFPVMQVGNRTARRLCYYVEQPDTRWLKRIGLDENGALYKFDQRGDLNPAFSDATNGVEKKTRKTENRADLQAVVNVLNKADRPGFDPAARSRFMFDNFNIASMVNYAACRAIINDYDDTRKNWYFHRNTTTTGEWHLLPWDKDGTFGIQGDAGQWWPHPFYSDKAHLKTNANQWSYHWEAIYNDPYTRPMYLRRLRTLMDEILQQQPGYLEERVDYWFSLYKPHLPANTSASSIKSWLNTRRRQLFTTYLDSPSNPVAANRLIPEAQPPDSRIEFGAIDFNPASGDQLEEYIELKNPNDWAVDVSGWTLTGGITHTLQHGTVILPRSSLYVARDVRKFRARATGPGGGQTLFAQGNYSGSLSARGETVVLTDPKGAGRVVAQISYEPNPTATQRFLRVSELMYHPADGPLDGDEYEFVELQNIGEEPLDLTGVSFVDGVTFTFPEGGPFNLLAPGATVLVVKNADAFAARYGAGLPVAGVYTGSLSNSGERLRLKDAVGEEVLDFTYSDAWQPSTDGKGASLTIVDILGSPESWNDPGAWTASAAAGGTPGTGVATAPPANDPGTLTIVARSATGVTLRYQGAPGAACRVWRSADLVTWEPLRSLMVDPSGEIFFTDGNPPAGRAWYRVSVP